MSACTTINTYSRAIQLKTYFLFLLSYNFLLITFLISSFTPPLPTWWLPHRIFWCHYIETVEFSKTGLQTQFMCFKLHLLHKQHRYFNFALLCTLLFVTKELHLCPNIHGRRKFIKESFQTLKIFCRWEDWERSQSINYLPQQILTKLIVRR